MTRLLVLLAFTLLFVPLVEASWEPFWSRFLSGIREPGRRLRLLALRMVGGLVLALVSAAALLLRVHHAPISHPLLPEGLVSCLGHAFEHGPGHWTVGLLLVATALLLGVITALFYPLPAFPTGARRPDLEAMLRAHGADATVEVLAGEEPACWSELSPHPRVVLLGGLEDLLPRDQLEAVLAHEAGHLVAGDHHTRIWVRAYRRLLFFFPVAAALFDAFVHEQERRADDQVLAWSPERRGALRRALLALATLDFPLPSPRRVEGAALGALGQEAWSVKQRLARLAGVTEDPPRPMPRPVWPLLGLASVLLVLASDPGACTLHCLLDSLP